MGFNRAIYHIRCTYMIGKLGGGVDVSLSLSKIFMYKQPIANVCTYVRVCVCMKKAFVREMTHILCVVIAHNCMKKSEIEIFYR